MRPRENPLYSSLAAIGSILVASSCCLPLGAFWLAAGLAGVSPFLNSVRPFMMASSIGLVVYGFWQARQAQACGLRPSAWHALLLWTAALFVIGSLVFPQAMAGLFAGRSGAVPSGQSALVRFNLAAFQHSFNDAEGLKVLVLLSPT